MNFGGSPVAEKNPYRQFVNKEGPENSEGCPGPSSCGGACYFTASVIMVEPVCRTGESLGTVQFYIPALFSRLRSWSKHLFFR